MGVAEGLAVDEAIWLEDAAQEGAAGVEGVGIEAPGAAKAEPMKVRAMMLNFILMTR